MRVSIVIPAKNEAQNLASLLPRLLEIAVDAECIVVNDGSADETIAVCRENGVKVVSHPYSKGNGAAIKTGARAASGDTIVFLDGDGQHMPEDIPRLLEEMEKGYDMVVGARVRESQSDSFRAVANGVYNRLASLITGHKILDLTSGFRAVNARKFREFLYLLPTASPIPLPALWHSFGLVTRLAIAQYKPSGVLATAT